MNNTNEDIKINIELPNEQFDDEWCSKCGDDNIAVTVTTEALHSHHRAPLFFKCFASLFQKGKRISIGEGDV